MADKDVKIKITAVAAEAMAKIKKFGKQFRDTGREAETAIGGIDRSLKGISAAAVGTAIGSVILKIGELGVASIKSANQMRQYEIAFSTMLKSADKGRTILQDLQRFAAETPFDVPGVVQSAQQLMAFGFAADEIIPTLRILGDTAAGLGKSSAGVQQIAYALGQIRTSGTLKTQDVNQLTNAGINAWEALAQASGKSIREIKEATEKGMIDSAKAIEVITASMADNFGGMMEQTAKEVDGLWNNITESIGTAQATLGAFAIDGLNLKGVLQSVSDAVSGVGAALMNAKNEGKSFGEALKEAVPPEVVVALGSLTAIIGVSLVAAIGAAVGALASFLGLTAPIVAGVVAIGAAAGGMYAYWEDISQAIDIAKFSLQRFIDTPLANLIPTIEGYINKLKGAKAAQDELASYSTYDSDYHDQYATATPAKQQTDLFTEPTKAAKSAESISKAIATARRETASLNKEMVRLQNDLLMAGLSGDERVRQSITNERNERLATLDAILEKQKAAVAEAQAIYDEALKTNHQKEIEDAQRLVEEKKAILEAAQAEQASIKAEIEQIHADDLASMVTQVEEAWRSYANSIASGFGNAVRDMIEGSKTAGQALKELLCNVITNVAQTAAQFLMLTGILSAFGVANAGNVAVKMMFGVDPSKIGSDGGKVNAATGGYVTGAGTSTSDSIPAMLSNGEYVMQASAVRRIGVPALNAMNAGRGFADGGLVAAKPVSVGGAGGSNNSVTINVSTLDAASFDSYLDNGGLNVIKQKLFDSDRNFAATAGVW